jgi:two-component system, OmpR family, sensor histidine kinase CpxA
MPLARFPLLAKTIIWFFLNLLLLAAVFLLIFGLSFRFEPWSPFFGGTGHRIEAVSAVISGAMDEKTREERDEILKRWTAAFKVDFYLFDSMGVQMGGEPINLPDDVANDIARSERHSPDERRAENAYPRDSGFPPPPGPPPMVNIRTANPTTYWLIIRTITFEEGRPQPTRTRLIVRSDSYYGYGLFFDPRPWIAAAAVVLFTSILFWLPFVRSITGSVAQMTAATQRIANENFSVRLNDRRMDELGILGVAINDLASRLDRFISGQKRFLGDISHELNSPLARMQFALSILENKARAEDQPHIADVKEEVELMSNLVRELLSYSKSGMQGAAVRLEPVRVRDIVERAVDREKSSAQHAVNIKIPDSLRAEAQPELLARAFANVIRNSMNYAGDEGEITISGMESNGSAVIRIADNGPGVPEEMLEKIFDPLFRVQDDRSRATGGTGLGLAIVKTCIETCNGYVSAKNILPHGLEIEIMLHRPRSA